MPNQPIKTTSTTVFTGIKEISHSRIQSRSFLPVAIIDLFENDGNYISRVRWTPYIFAGISIFHMQPKGQAPATDLNGTALEQAGKWVNLRPLGTEGQYSPLKETDANYGINHTVCSRSQFLLASVHDLSSLKR